MKVTKVNPSTINLNSVTENVNIIATGLVASDCAKVKLKTSDDIEKQIIVDATVAADTKSLLCSFPVLSELHADTSTNNKVPIEISLNDGFEWISCKPTVSIK